MPPARVSRRRRQPARFPAPAAEVRTSSGPWKAVPGAGTGGGAATPFHASIFRQMSSTFGAYVVLVAQLPLPITSHRGALPGGWTLAKRTSTTGRASAAASAVGEA